MNIKHKIKQARHLGEYDTVAVVMWVFLLSLLIVPLLFALIAGAVALVVGAL